MHDKLKNNAWIIIFIFPVLFSFLLTALGFPVHARDDNNYIKELSFRSYDIISYDYISWSIIIFIHSFLNDQVLAMRLIGLLLTIATIASIKKGENRSLKIFYFIISILPIYWSVYFNQVRLGIAFCIYLFIVTRGYPRIAIIGASFAHLSVFALLFPAAIVVIPFVLEVVYTLDPTSFAAVRFAAYRSAEFFQMPWYLGWELVVISCIFLVQKGYKNALSIILYIMASRMLVDLISLDVGRRLIELGLFIYSPLNTYLLTRREPARPMLLFYFSLGALAAFKAFTDGVIFFG